MADRTLPSVSPPSAEPGTILLETERVIMRRYLPTDAAGLATAANYTEVSINLRDGFPSPYTLANAESFISSCCGPVANCYPLNVALFVKPNTADNPTSEPIFIGATGIMPKEDVNYRTWELGYWMTPPAWGRGYTTEAIRAFVPWCFGTWPTLNRIEALCFSRNGQSLSVLKKCGFVEEGRKRGSAEKHGEIMDELLYAVLRSDLERS